MKSAVSTLVVVAFLGSVTTLAEESPIPSERNELVIVKRENERLRLEVEKLTKKTKDYEKQQASAEPIVWAYAAFGSAFIDEDPAVRKWAVKALVQHFKNEPRHVKVHIERLLAVEKDESVRDEVIRAYQAYLEKQKAVPPVKPPDE